MEDLPWVSCRASLFSKWIDMLSSSIWNLHPLFTTLGFSTQALKPYSLDPHPRSRFPFPNRIQCSLAWSSTQHADYAHCTAGLDLRLTHYPGALPRSTACSSDPDRGCVEAKWSLNLDPRSASDPDPYPMWRAPFLTQATRSRNWRQVGCPEMCIPDFETLTPLGSQGSTLLKNKNLAVDQD